MVLQYKASPVAEAAMRHSKLNGCFLACYILYEVSAIMLLVKNTNSGANFGQPLMVSYGEFGG